MTYRPGENWHHCLACDIKWEDAADHVCFGCGREVPVDWRSWPRLNGTLEMVPAMPDDLALELGLPI